MNSYFGTKYKVIVSIWIKFVLRLCILPMLILQTAISA
jgi:hypothetical protein